MFSFPKKNRFQRKIFLFATQLKNDKSEKWWKVMKSDGKWWKVMKSDDFITFHHFSFFAFFCKNIFCKKTETLPKNTLINDNILFQGMNQRQKLQMRSSLNLVSFKQKIVIVWSWVFPQKINWGLGWRWVLTKNEFKLVSWVKLDLSKNETSTG